MTEITVEIPEKLAEFIDKLVKEGYFTSREDFSRCSIEMIAELYGLSKTAPGGKSLLDILNDKSKTLQTPIQKIEKKFEPTKPIITATPPQPKQNSSDELISEEYDIIDLFVGTNFEFEDALHAKFTMERMKIAKPPLPKDEFLTLLEGLAKKGNIERSEHNGKVVWKILERY